MSLRRDIDWFISKSKSIHGDRFDYSNSVYVNAITKIEIRCIKHNNIFYQIPRNHFNAPNSCKDCKFEKNSRPQDTDKFIQKAKIVHGDRYDYSKVIYKNFKTDVIIVCKKHGDFIQKPSSHLATGGCRKCGLEMRREKSMRPPKGKSLAEINPIVSKQWHPTKNGDLTPYDVFAKSGEKAWWKCPKGEDHEWDTSIGNRCNGSGCPICADQRLVRSNSLAIRNPDLAKEWHPTKNGDLTPFDVFSSEGTKVWWKCDKGDDHEWQATINSRSAGNGCSVCSGKTIVKSNCLATLRPELAKEWHPTKNGHLTPFNFSEYSAEIVWWKCDKGDDHEWESAISNRSSGNGCSVCHGLTIVESNCLATLNPKLTKEWHPTKNGDLTPFDVTIKSNNIVWWKCDKGDDHEWDASIASRSSGSNCPICVGQKVVFSNSLAKTHEYLITEWHPTKNGNLTPFDITSGSNLDVWWKCDKGDDHIYECTPKERTRGGNCSICAGKKVVLSNCLATLRPELAKEWHPIKNGNITPYDFTVGSNMKVWWKCPKGEDHVWEAGINSRAGGNGCAICAGQIVVNSNCLAILNPKLSKQWHPIKNGDLTPYNVTLFSGKKVWWKCDKGEDHEWKTAIANRAKGKDCPFCTLTPQSKQELTITFELIQFFNDINPKGFKTRIDGKLYSIDIYIPQLKLGVEFDGSYWHKDNEAKDKLKTVQLEDEGFEVFRVRQEPLKRIFDDDIMSKQPFNAKKVTNDILTQIMSRYTLDTKKTTKIESYIAMKELDMNN